MEQEFNQQDYNWVYYVIGLTAGILIGFVVEGHVILGAVLGLLFGGLVKFAVNKSRTYKHHKFSRKVFIFTMCWYLIS